MANVAAELRGLGTEYIEYTVFINDTIPLATWISMTGDVPVNINMTLNDSLQLDMQIPVRQSISVPLDLALNKVLHIDTTLTLPDTMKLYIEGDIPVNEKLSLAGIDRLRMKVKGTINMRQLLNAKLVGNSVFSADVPITLRIRENISVPVNFPVGIHQKVPINLTIASTASVSFGSPVKVTGKIPVQLAVPVRIPLEKTAIKRRMDSAAEHLSDLFF